MNNSLFIRVIQDVNEHHYKIDEICAKFYVNDAKELADYLSSTFSESLNEFIEIPSFISDYHTFLFSIVDAMDNGEDIQYLSMNLGRQITPIRELLKPYNKKEKPKDRIYYQLIRLNEDIQSNQRYSNDRLFTIYENDNVKVLKHIIYDIRDLDLLNHILCNHKEIVNVYSNDEEPFVITVIREFINDLDSISIDDIDYFKRVITMLLMRDELKLDMNKVDEIRKEIAILLPKSEENRKHLVYLEYIISKTQDFTLPNRTLTDDLMVPKYLLDGRMDLRSVPTISIDFIRYPHGTKLLFDDAFSLQEKPDGTLYLWMHIPDVDEYIPRGGEIDNYMRDKGESVYIKGSGCPMIPYHISKKLSLSAMNERAALSFRIHVDQEGKVLGIKYYKTVIRVDDNLSRSKADLVIKNPSYPYRELLEKMASISKKLREQRHETIGKRTKSGIIMDEFNIWTNIATASFFERNGIVFPFKNYLGDDYGNKYIDDVRNFLKDNPLDEDARLMVYEFIEAKSRPFYSTFNLGNAHFNKLPYGNIGNPLREYMSLETDRLIKDLVIDELGNLDYWTERIENDCVELSETSSKVKELYKTRY